MNEDYKKQYIERQMTTLQMEVGNMLRKEWNNNQEIEIDVGVFTEALRGLITTAKGINSKDYGLSIVDENY